MQFAADSVEIKELGEFLAEEHGGMHLPSGFIGWFLKFTQEVDMWA